jgi:hypothetical protein
MRPTRRELAIAIVAGTVVEWFLAAVTSTFPGPGGSFGAPIPMGESSGLDFTGGHTAVYWPFFVIDVLVTSAALFLALRWGGIKAAVAATAGGLLASLIALISYLFLPPLRGAGIVPFAGFPIPVAFSRETGMNALLLWVNCFLLGLLGVALWHGIRALRGRERSPQSKRPLSSA